jgi:hypothetical protein
MAQPECIFNQETINAFDEYLNSHPNNRRVTPDDYADIVSWLTDPNRHPADQEEHSRRHYVKRTFSYDQSTSILFSFGPSKDLPRPVVGVNKIAHHVQYIHVSIGHLGWDATWRQVSASCYGILRADVIFLLKRCLVCAGNPRKRPKGSNQPRE